MICRTVDVVVDSDDLGLLAELTSTQVLKHPVVHEFLWCVKDRFDCGGLQARVLSRHQLEVLLGR